MDANSVLRVVYDQLVDSHDIRNTQIRLYQIASNPELVLSPGQRGALNFYSSLSNIDEQTLLNLISTVMDKTPTLSTHVTDLPLTFEPVVKQTKSDKYQWNLENDTNTNQTLIIDPTLYSTPHEAQQRADQFMSELSSGDEKSWIRLGIVNWMHQPHPSQHAVCQAELLNINRQHYVLVTHRISEPMTKEIQEQRTIHYTSKVINLEPMVNPSWITRGFIPQSSHGLFYILFRINPQPTDSLQTLTQHLSHLLC